MVFYGDIRNNNKVIGAIINGKYDINGTLVPNNIIKYNNRYQNTNNNYNIGINSILRESNKINVSLHESYPRFESFLNCPKIDQPPPNIDEISENMLNN